MERAWWKRPCADAEREDGGAPAPHQAPAKAQRQHTMTGPEDSHSSTRPISVAELLARNGSIGAPPVGGRRRRRRGNADAVTVAELTGELPIITDATHSGKADEPVSTNGAAAEHVEAVDLVEEPEAAEPVAPAVDDQFQELEEASAA